MVNVGVDRFEHETLHRQGLGSEQCGRPAQGFANDSNRLGWKPVADELDCASRIQAFKPAKRNVATCAFAMRLKIEKENREARRIQPTRAGYHAQPIRPDAVHQDDCATTWSAGHEPTAKKGPRGRRDLDGLRRQIRRRAADRLARG
jgi:hypothetical protein